jgi:hypothetical protein
MRAARLQELEEMAARLLALARKLPPGQQRDDVIQEIGNDPAPARSTSNYLAQN